MNQVKTTLQAMTEIDRIEVEVAAE